MFPLIIVLIFSLFQSFNADNEFPNLPQYIRVTWDGVQIPRDQVDFKLTTSFNGAVPYIIFCGPFKTEGKDATCDWYANYAFREETWINIPSGKVNAKNILTINDNDSCMRVDNTLPDFPRLYKDTVENYGKISMSYKCQTASTVNPVYVVIGFIVLLLIGAAAFVGFSAGKKNNTQNLQENAYGAYGGKNTNNMYASPSYGNPFGQTA